MLEVLLRVHGGVGAQLCLHGRELSWVGDNRAAKCCVWILEVAPFEIRFWDHDGDRVQRLDDASTAAFTNLAKRVLATDAHVADSCEDLPLAAIYDSQDGLRFNPHAQRLLGYGNGDVPDFESLYRKLYGCEAPQRFSAPFEEEVVIPERPAEIGAPAMLPSGESKHLRFFAGYRQGRRYWLVIESAVDELSTQEMALELQRAKELASLALKSRTAFWSTMSHEIRTPLNGVLGATQLLEKTNLSLDQRDLLTTVRMCSETLMGLLDEASFPATAERGPISNPKGPEEISEILRQIARALRAEASAQNVEVVVSGPEAGPIFIDTNVAEVQAILLEVTRLCVRQKRDGRVVLTANIVAESQDDDRRVGVHFDLTQMPKVNDAKPSGPGRSYAFEVETELARLRERAKKINCAFNFSNASELTAVNFVVPCRRDASIPVITNAPPENTGSVAGLRVLVAEDHPINQRILVRALDHLGCVCEVAGDGLEVLSLLREKKYDVILMDCQMPNLDGFETTKQIRAHGDNQVPVVALTANAMPGDSARCIEAGMNDYLAKPVRLRDLEAALIRWGRPRPAVA
jgi:CheY-like chemotaxis protein